MRTAIDWRDALTRISFVAAHGLLRALELAARMHLHISIELIRVRMIALHGDEIKAVVLQQVLTDEGANSVGAAVNRDSARRERV